MEVDDDRVVALAYQRGIGKGSGAPVDLHFGAVYDFTEEGLLARVQIYLDQADALRAVGLGE